MPINKGLRVRWRSLVAAVFRVCLISATRAAPCSTGPLHRRASLTLTAQAVLLVAFSPFVTGRPGVRGCRWITLSSSVAR